MKNNFFKLLYKIFSFLADKTGGAKMFSKPKLFFGAMLIGAVGIGTTSCVRCYVPPHEPTCYEPIPDTTQVDTTEITEPPIMCYDSAEPQP